MGYKEDISIDVTNMEAECATHPTTHVQYGIKHADALRARRQAEQEEEEATAAADTRIRAQLVGQKTTETEIKRMVTTDPSYQSACRKSLDAAHEVNVLAAALDALNAKTRMLGNIVTMQVAHWQAEPQVENRRPVPYAVVRKDAQEEATAAQHDGLKGIRAPLPNPKTTKRSKPQPVSTK